MVCYARGIFDLFSLYYADHLDIDMFLYLWFKAPYAGWTSNWWYETENSDYISRCQVRTFDLDVGGVKLQVESLVGYIENDS